MKSIEELERLEQFDVDVLDDPPAPVLLPNDADYYCKKLRNRLGRYVANFIADRYFLGLIRKGELMIDGITGEERLAEVLKNGAVITCNHFSPYDNYVVFHCIRRYLPKKYLYKVIREGNYTNFPGLYGFFFRHCHTLPLSSDRHTMARFLEAADTLLKGGESILIYPEQALWPDYRKPRPFKDGAFRIAFKAGVPVVPLFITWPETADKPRYTLHVLENIYPDNGLSVKAGARAMAEAAYGACRDCYERVYGKKLVYGENPPCA